MSADVISLRLVRFARTLRRLTGDSVGVQLVPELEAETISYGREMPDRLLAGRDAFDVLVRFGYRVLEPRMPAGLSLRAEAQSYVPRSEDTPFLPARMRLALLAGAMRGPLPHLSVAYVPDPDTDRPPLDEQTAAALSFNGDACRE